MKAIVITAMIILSILYISHGCLSKERIEKIVSTDPVTAQRQLATERLEAETKRLWAEESRARAETNAATEKTKLTEQRTRLMAAERALREELAKSPPKDN